MRTLAIVTILMMGLSSFARCQRSGLTDDEKELIRQADEESADLASSGMLFEDSSQIAYLETILHRLGGKVNDFSSRFFHAGIVRSPQPNSFSFPNGHIYATTGLMSLCHNEGELAFILAHEIGHIVKRHAYQMLQRSRSVSDRLDFPLYGLGSMLAGISLRRYSIATEIEADIYGESLMSACGYDPWNSVRIMESFAEEEKEDSVNWKLSMMKAGGLAYEFPLPPGGHPETPDRIALLKKLITTSPPTVFDAVARQRYASSIFPTLIAEGYLDLQYGDYRSAGRTVAKAVAVNPTNAEARLVIAELFRQKSASDVQEAIRRYRKVLEIDSTNALAYRGLGIVFQRLDQRSDARTSFQQYLRYRPDAPDRLFILKYVGEYSGEN